MTVELIVNIDADDLDKAVAFYRDALGLRAGRRLGGLGVEMLGAASAIHLLAKPAGSRAAPTVEQARDYRRHWTPVHLDVLVPDVEAAVARAEGAGAVREGAVETYAWGRIAYMADPFGHGFCLVELQGRGYDAIAEETA